MSRRDQAVVISLQHGTEKAFTLRQDMPRLMPGKYTLARLHQTPTNKEDFFSWC
ncbi:MAG: hypothetical protein KJ804_15685 [Proteobacteria bacterium]|nr:hypothetical protein [Pseudomonadota bacterium]MBU1059753.1 hypothetical protein [Pseudomonadota bacterium]